MSSKNEECLASTDKEKKTTTTERFKKVIKKTLQAVCFPSQEHGETSLTHGWLDVVQLVMLCNYKNQLQVTTV